jgi:hypothetical protein
MDEPLSEVEQLPPLPDSPVLPSTPQPPLRPLHEIPIPERPKEPTDWVQLILFTVVFDTACLFAHICQLSLLPLSYLPYPWAKKYYEDAQSGIKGNFGTLLGASSTWHRFFRP